MKVGVDTAENVLETKDQEGQGQVELVAHVRVVLVGLEELILMLKDLCNKSDVC